MKRKIKNYVGFKWIQNLIHPPFWFLFNASAKIHDKNYEKGGSRGMKLTADMGFLWRMLHDINKIRNFKKKRRALYVALSYFIAVRLFGWIGFNYR